MASKRKFKFDPAYVAQHDSPGYQARVHAIIQAVNTLQRQNTDDLRDNAEALVEVATKYLEEVYGPAGAALRLYGAADGEVSKIVGTPWRHTVKDPRGPGLG